MRIKDLFEGQSFQNYEDFITSDEDKNEKLNYDLTEDLVFFMNHDDDSYRRHVYPAIVKCMRGIDKKMDQDASIFKTAALESYKNYLHQYPIRALPNDLDDNQLKEICSKFYENLCKDIDEGKYS